MADRRLTVGNVEEAMRRVLRDTVRAAIYCVNDIIQDALGVARVSGTSAGKVLAIQIVKLSYEERADFFAALDELSEPEQRSN